MIMKKIIIPFLLFSVALIACGENKESKETATAGSETSAPKSMLEQSAADSPEGIALKNLMNQSNCGSCHQIDAKSIGPSYVEVAEKYDNNEETIAYLAEKIMKGGSGVWGEVPMTEHPDLTQAEAESLAKDIMALKNINP